MNQDSVIAKDRYERATTYDEYVERMQVNQQQMTEFTDEIEIPADDVEWWKQQPNLNVLVLTYDGCGDALYNIPVMAKIAQHCPNIDLRVVQRDDNLDIMEHYLNQGMYQSVPTFIFMDENLMEIGNLKERPSAMTEVFDREGIRLRRSLREQNKEPWRAEMVRELREVVATKKQYD